MTFIDWLLIALPIAYIVGACLTFSTGAFSWERRTPATKLQDDIQWMHWWLQALAWPVFALLWVIESAKARRSDGERYVPHGARMEQEIDDVVDALHEPVLGASYTLPSPREYRKHGISAANIIVTVG